MMKAFFPYAEETQGIIVRVAVNYLAEQSEPGKQRWFWSYHIRIENGSDEPVQLLTRHWLITDADGDEQIIDGEGVVGEQPVIKPGASYDYVSGCPLATPSGSMRGSYGMIGRGGERRSITIPHFALREPVVSE